MPDEQSASDAAPGLSHTCNRCAAPLAADARACTACHALVHAQRLEQLADLARDQTSRQDFLAARVTWLSALELLPPEATQAQWIRATVGELQARIAAASPPPAQPGWIGRLGPFAPLALLLLKGKGLLALFNLKFLLSFGAFVALYWNLYGVWFGVGFSVLLLVHELGHLIEIKRRGLPVDMPVFLPGVGAYVRWTALGVSTQTRSLISLAGPAAGLLGGAVCALLWIRTGTALWVALASLTALVNAMNLIPVWVLDGGQAIAALDRNERLMLAVAAVAFAAYFGQPLLLLVAAGAIYRLFTKDLPTRPSHGTIVYYLLLLAGLAYLMGLAPPVAR